MPGSLTNNFTRSRTAKEIPVNLRRASIAVVVALMLTSASLVFGQAQGSQHAAIIIPDSTVERPTEIGINAHTNHLIRANGGHPASSLPSGETPQSIYPVYGLTFTGQGGSNVIVIVDAF